MSNDAAVLRLLWFPGKGDLRARPQVAPRSYNTVKRDDGSLETRFSFAFGGRVYWATGVGATGRDASSAAAVDAERKYQELIEKSPQLPGFGDLGGSDEADQP